MNNKQEKTTLQIECFNNYANTNLKNSQGHFCKKIRSYFPYISNLTTIDASLSRGNENINIGSIPITFRGDLNNRGYSDFYLPEKLLPGQLYQLTLSFISEDNIAIGTQIITIAKDIKLIDNFQPSIKKIKPYTQRDLFFNLRNIFMKKENIDFSQWYLNNFSDYSFHLSSTNWRTPISANLSDSSTVDTLSFKGEISSVLDFIQEHIAPDNQVIEGFFWCEISDVFNRKFSEKVPVQIDMREGIVNITNLSIKKNNVNLNNGNFIYQKDVLSFSYTIEDYNKEDIKIIIQKAETAQPQSEITEKEWVNLFETALFIPKVGSYLKPTFQTGIYHFPFGEIPKENYLHFRIIAKDQLKTLIRYFDYNNILGVCQKEADMQIVGYSLQPASNSTGQMITINYQLNNIGIMPINQLDKATLYFQCQTNQSVPFLDTKIINNVMPSNQTQKATLNYILPKEVNFINIRLKLVTETKNPQKNNNKKESYSAFQFVANTVATYSFRKNQFGINTNNLDDISNQNVSFLIGYNNKKNKVIFETNNKDNMSFDLTTNKVDGLIINGGTW